MNSSNFEHVENTFICNVSAAVCLQFRGEVKDFWNFSSYGPFKGIPFEAVSLDGIQKA